MAVHPTHSRASGRSPNAQPIVRQEIVETNQARGLDDLAAASIGKKSVEYDEARIAVGATENGKLQDVIDLEGKVDWSAFRYDAKVSAYEAFVSWANYATENGFDVEFSCARQRCGRHFIRSVLDLNGNIAEGGEQWSENSGYYFLAKSSAGDKSTYLGLLTYRQPNGFAVSHYLAVVTDTPDFSKIIVNAESLAAEIEEKGKVVVYGIYFDTGRAEVKPDSAPTLAEIARLLTLRPQLSLYVDGHTDNQGAEDYNLELSRLRSSVPQHHLVRPPTAKLHQLGQTGPVHHVPTRPGMPEVVESKVLDSAFSYRRR